MRARYVCEVCVRGMRARYACNVCVRRMRAWYVCVRYVCEVCVRGMCAMYACNLCACDVVCARRMCVRYICVQGMCVSRLHVTYPVILHVLWCPVRCQTLWLWFPRRPHETDHLAQSQPQNRSTFFVASRECRPEEGKKENGARSCRELQVAKTNISFVLFLETFDCSQTQGCRRYKIVSLIQNTNK